MLTSVLQQPAHQERLRSVERVQILDMDMSMFATNYSRGPFPLQTHYKTSVSQKGSPKQKKHSISRRSESSMSKSSQESRSKEGPLASINEESAGSSLPRGQVKRVVNDRKKKNSNIPPRFKVESQKRQRNKTDRNSALNSAAQSKEKEVSPLTGSDIDTTLGAAATNGVGSIEVEAAVSSPLEIGEPMSQCSKVCDVEQRMVNLALRLSAMSSPVGSRRSSIGSDEELFQDALSYLPLPERVFSVVSSTNSSAFVTPASSRSQSPVNDTAGGSLENSLPDSLEQLRQEQVLDLLDKSVEISQGDSLSCGSHMTLTEDNENSTESNSSQNCPYTFTHNSQIHSQTDDQPIPRNYSSNTKFQMVVGDIEVEVNGLEYENSVFEFPCSPVDDEEHDSGCGMSIGSPSKTRLKHKEKRAGLIHIPQEVSHQISRGRSIDFSSLSTASPKSSISSTSPLSLSPSPTPPLTTQAQSEAHQAWPDFTTPVMKPSPSVATTSINGATQTSVTEQHHPTREDMARMEQWRNNLLAQLRTQQEKLDQKKKQRVQESSLPPLLPMLLPPEALPPPPSLPFLPHGSLPLHRSLPPNLFSAFHPIPPHTTPMFMPPLLNRPPQPHTFTHPPVSEAPWPHALTHPSVDDASRPHTLTHPPVDDAPRPHTLTHPPVNEAPQPHALTHPPMDEASLMASWPTAERVTRQLSLTPTVEDTHPLCNRWVLWYDKIIGSHRNSFSDYKASLKQIHTVKSVEDFWQLFNNIKLPSVLENSTNYHFFKEGVNPLWEDPANESGGKWVLTIKDNPHILDRAWMEVLLWLIGGSSGKKDFVNGVVVSRRKKGNRIAIWTNQKAKKLNLEICRELIGVLTNACGVQTEQLPTFLKHLCECKNGMWLMFLHHTDSLRSGSSYQNESHIKLKDHLKDLSRDLGCR